MSATVRYTDDTRTILLDVEGEEPLVQEFSRNGRTFLPWTVVLTFQRHGNRAWSLSSAKVNGAVVKKDGTPGEQHAHNTYSSYGRDKAPQWVNDLIEQHHPGGTFASYAEPATRT